VPGPAGGAKALPIPPSRDKGAYFSKGRERKGREERKEGRGREKEGGWCPPHDFFARCPRNFKFNKLIIVLL